MSPARRNNDQMPSDVAALQTQLRLARAQNADLHRRLQTTPSATPATPTLVSCLWASVDRMVSTRWKTTIADCGHGWRRPRQPSASKRSAMPASCWPMKDQRGHLNRNIRF